MDSDSRHYSLTPSIESFHDDRRHPALPNLTKIFNRHRSVTISTSGSSAETATNGATVSTGLDVFEDQTLRGGNLQGKSSKPSGKKSNYHSAPCRMGDSELEQSPSLMAAVVPNRVDSCPATSFEAHQKLGGKGIGHKAGSHTTQRKTASLGSEVAAFQQTERTSIKIRDLLEDLDSDDSMPLHTGPRLIHRSSPPWMEVGREEACAGHLYSSHSRFGPDDQATGCLNHSQQPRHSKTGLKKLLKSVKVTLRSTTHSANHLTQETKETMNDKLDGHGPQSLLSSLNQSRISDPFVEAHSPTALAQNHPNHSSTIRPDDSTTSLSRTVSSCSIFSVGTSTIPSASITPSSSWSSLPGAQSDRAIADQSGPHCPKHQHPAMTISLHTGELGRHSTMGTSHSLTCTHPPSHFESCFGTRNIYNKGDYQCPSARILKSKRSFGFLQNIKRAVTGVDPTLSFSFHNHLTPSLTTSAVSLPIGNVVRNNGLDPLPACHPLPLKSSQSSPSNLDYSLLTSTKPEALRVETVLSPRAASIFSSGHDEYSNMPHSAPSHLHESISQPELLRLPPKLNLRPVSMPFAAGFSDQFLFDGLNLFDPQDQDPEDQAKNNIKGPSCAHHRYCPCCRSLADENVHLKNRIKELEMILSKNQSST